MNALTEEAQKLAQDPLIALFRFDASTLGGTVMYFCMAADSDSEVSFGGVSYTPVDCEFSEMEINAGGSLPRPTIRLAASNGVFQSIVNTYGDLLGCTFQRIRTFKKFLDGQPEHDATMYYGPDTFKVERKTKEGAIFLEWELSASIDQEGKMLPGRQVIRDTCMWRYRSWNGTSWDYSKAQCPYTGSAYFNRSGGVETDPTKDVCGRKVSDCKLRFGASAALPFGGFPGVSRIKLP